MNTTTVSGAVLPAPLPPVPLPSGRAAELPAPAAGQKPAAPDAIAKPTAVAGIEEPAFESDSAASIRTEARKRNSAIEEKISADRKELREWIGAIKANGSAEMIQVSRGIAVPDTDMHSAIKLFAAADNSTIKLFGANSPAELLREKGTQWALAAHQLLPDPADKKILLPPIGLLITPLSAKEPERVRIQVTDYLNPGRSAVLDQRINLNDAAQCKEFCGRIDSVFSKRFRDGTYAKAVIAAIPGKGFEPAVTEHHTELNPAGGLGRLAQDFSHFSLTVLPGGAAREKTFQDIELSTDKIEKGVAINGQLRSISATRPIVLESGEFTLDTSGKLATIHGHPAVSSYQDKIGNYVVRYPSYTRNAQAGDTILETIDISPPHNYSINGEKMRKITADLSPLGYGEATVLAVARTLGQTGTVGGLQFYTDTDPLLLKRNYRKQLLEIAEGAHQAEQLFKLAAGADIQKVAILDSDRPNAFYSKMNPQTIVILDERLRGKGQIESARHEAFHLVDGKYDYRFSAGLTEIFNSIKEHNPQFFRKLNESAFNKNIAFGGHSADNPKEFFASLMNSIAYENCEQQLKKLDPAFRRDYAAALRAAGGQFRSEPGFPADAPILVLIEQRLSSPVLKGR